MANAFGEYIRESSIHGIKYIKKKRMSTGERFFILQCNDLKKIIVF